MFGQLCQVSGDQPDSAEHRVCAVQHPALLPWWHVCDERPHHGGGLVLWRLAGIGSAGQYDRTLLSAASYSTVQN